MDKAFSHSHEKLLENSASYGEIIDEQKNSKPKVLMYNAYLQR